jgi:hypothetical protein
VYTVAMRKEIDSDEQLRGVGPDQTAAEERGSETAALPQPSPDGIVRPGPLLLLLAMLAALFFLDAVLPLGGLWFPAALPGHAGSWLLLPGRLLFPGAAVSASITGDNPAAPGTGLSWREAPLLLLAFALVFGAYLLAVWRLPQLMSRRARRYILYSTAIFGLLYALFPVVTSPDLFSYIAYARMGVLYHLNPLTTLPNAITTDPVYLHLYWKNQPSAYGPTWAAMTCALQWLTLPFGAQTLRPMVVALRLCGLAAHLCSTLLIWSMIGRLQLLQGPTSAGRRAARTLSTLAFAWNPLLLFEACVNAHNDAEVLLLILLAIWLLLPGKRSTPSLLAAVALLALATCLKANVVVLLPLVLIGVWKTRGLRLAALSGALWAGVVILLYAPFWQQGAILNVLGANPTTSRNINSLAEFSSYLYNSLGVAHGQPLRPDIGSPAEVFAHTLSIASFVVIYVALCWLALRGRAYLGGPLSLVRWLGVAWLLYCLLGAPWFWPWYLVTFCGLSALGAGTCSEKTRRLLLPASMLLTFSMLSIYFFYAWGLQASYIPGLPHFQWAYIRGLWAWLIPLLALAVSLFISVARRRPRPAAPGAPD